MSKQELQNYSYMVATVVGILVIVTAIAITLGMKLYLQLFPAAKAKKAAQDAQKEAQKAEAAALEAGNKAVEAEQAASEAVESFRRMRR